MRSLSRRPGRVSGAAAARATAEAKIHDAATMRRRCRANHTKGRHSDRRQPNWRHAGSWRPPRSLQHPRRAGRDATDLAPDVDNAPNATRLSTSAEGAATEATIRGEGGIGRRAAIDAEVDLYVNKRRGDRVVLERYSFEEGFGWRRLLAGLRSKNDPGLGVVCYCIIRYVLSSCETVVSVAISLCVLHGKVLAREKKVSVDVIVCLCSPSLVQLSPLPTANKRSQIRHIHERLLISVCHVRE